LRKEREGGGGEKGDKHSHVRIMFLQHIISIKEKDKALKDFHCQDLLNFQNAHMISEGEDI
jgi:hypothetical protein